jgi:hypothetical protein
VTLRARRGADGRLLRAMLISRWDETMQRWRIPGHPYGLEQALKSGADVVVTSGRLAAALELAGLPCDRFDTGGPDSCKPWLLGADDTLSEIRDEHVADMAQEDFDELVEGRGPSKTLAGSSYDPQAVVEKHRDWTAAIRGKLDTRRRPEKP